MELYNGNEVFPWVATCFFYMRMVGGEFTWNDMSCSSSTETFLAGAMWLWTENIRKPASPGCPFPHGTLSFDPIQNPSPCSFPVSTCEVTPVLGGFCHHPMNRGWKRCGNPNQFFRISRMIIQGWYEFLCFMICQVIWVCLKIGYIPNEIAI